MKRDLTQLDKLESYLIKKGIQYERHDEAHTEQNGFVTHLERHQIIAYDDQGKRQWDAICQQGSYGCDAGLLEIYGNIVDEEKDGDSVVGWLTAFDVIERIKAKEENDERRQADGM